MTLSISARQDGMLPHEVAAILYATEAVCAHDGRRAEHTKTVLGAETVLRVDGPKIALTIELDTEVARRSFVGPRRFDVTRTTLTWIDGVLTRLTRRVPSPHPHAEIEVQLLRDLGMYHVATAGDVPMVLSAKQLVQTLLLVPVVAPWKHVAPYGRAAPPTLEELLARVPWDTVHAAVLDFRRAALAYAALDDMPRGAPWVRSTRRGTPQFTRALREKPVRLDVHGATSMGIALVGFRVGDDDAVQLGVHPVDLMRGAWVLKIGVRKYVLPAHPFARCGAAGADLRWVVEPPRPVAGLLTARANELDVD